MRFVFVHGGFHAAWCWEHTIAELRKLGHDGVAVDLPGHGARVAEESTLANRRAAIVEVMQPGDVLVGHSGGGFDATLAADAAPELVGHIAYLAAALPREGRTYPELVRFPPRRFRHLGRFERGTTTEASRSAARARRR